MQNLDGWKPYEEAKKIIAETGEATVYFVAVSCRGNPGARESKKLEKWLDSVIQSADVSLKLVQLREYEYSDRGERIYLQPAIKARIKSLTDFTNTWFDLQKIRNSSCGCSLMVSDSQHYDVRVMTSNFRAAAEIPSR